MSEQVDLKEFVAGFLAEAEEHLVSAGKNLLEAEAALRAGQRPARQVRDLFRSLHTLKGLAAMVGVEPIVALAHQMEAVLRAADNAGGALGNPAVELLVRGTRAIEERLASLSLGQPVAAPPEALLRALEALRDAPAPSLPAGPVVELEPELAKKLSSLEREQLAQGVATGQSAFRIDFRPTPEGLAQGLNITALRERLAKLGEVVRVVPLSVARTKGAPGGLSFAMVMLSKRSAADLAGAAGLSAEDVRVLRVVLTSGGAAEQSLPPEEEEPGELAAAARPALVRVDVARLDEALEKLSQLVVTRHRLARVVGELASRGVDVRELTLVLGETVRQLRDLRVAIMAARMVRLTEILQRVPLIVRGLGKSTGKSVRLHLDLGRAEVDKAVGDRLFPAVVHLIRNAVDHGLELPAERARLGKPPEGEIRVAAHPRSSSELELRIEDDGRGVDPQAVARLAFAPLPTDDFGLLELITRPGLTTRASPDHTSGRGMGMDIVRQVVQVDLSGTLLLENRPGKGTTFVLRVPVSVAIMDAFTFEVSAQRFAVPVSAVEEILDLEGMPSLSPPAVGRGAGVRLLERRGDALALVDLGAVFASGREADPPRKALVIRRNGAPFAFGVSRMLGQQEIVVRPLEDPLVKVPGITGSTDLGDGRPTLVLDLGALPTEPFSRPVSGQPGNP